MSAIQNRRVILWCERMALCLAVLVLCVHSLPKAWRTLNTDFPNYYLAARLAREHQDTARMYEWQWIEREKDHRDIDNRVLGMLPLTPFSTLAISPVSSLPPLTAKHIWILLNLAFLVPIGFMLRAMSGLSFRRVALILLLSFPLYRNLLYGQFYILLLLLLTGACFSYLRGYRALSGSLIAVAAACKIFPVFFFLIFLRRRDWRLLGSGAVTGMAAVASSIAVFGLSAHRTWLQQILPWVTRGEGLGTYAITPSISGILHRLFLDEPQWNPHPWHTSPMTYALLAPSLQMLALAPAILLVRKGDATRQRLLLEWCAMLTAVLAISTIPASYNFVLMIFPLCFVAAQLLRDRHYGWLIALVIAYLGIGFPLPTPQKVAGLALLLYVPRLPLMIAVLCGIYLLLWKEPREDTTDSDWTTYAWALAMTASAALSIWSTFHTEVAERTEYAYRLPLRSQGFLNAEPQRTPQGIGYSAFTLNGYRIVHESADDASSEQDKEIPFDELSFASDQEHLLVEQASVTGSRIVDMVHQARPLVENASQPRLSRDGHDLVFLRTDNGSGGLMLRRNFMSNILDTQLSPTRLNVYEAAFHSESLYAFSGTERGTSPKIFVIDKSRTTHVDAIADARYPSLSPDEHWLAYSHLDHGVWNLWLQDRNTGLSRRIADIPCNQIEPSWEEDSKTLLYATDCGRSIWFTAVARRKVIP